MLDPTQYQDWQIAQEAEKGLPPVSYFQEQLGLLPQEIIPYGNTPKLDFMKIMARLEKEDIIKRMVSLEFNRFLEYYRNAPEIESVAERRGRDGKESRGERKGGTTRRAEEGYVRLFLNLGKTDNFYAAQIIDLVNRNVRGKKVNIGRIDLMKNFSFFEVDERQAETIVRALNKVKVDGRKVVVEVADEAAGSEDAHRPSASRGNRRTERRDDRPGKTSAKPEASRKAKKDKPSRAERGYTEARGPKKKDDWKQFFDKDRPWQDEEPDFSEEGWAWRKKR